MGSHVTISSKSRSFTGLEAISSQSEKVMKQSVGGLLVV